MPRRDFSFKLKTKKAAVDLVLPGKPRLEARGRMLADLEKAYGKSGLTYLLPSPDRENGPERENFGLEVQGAELLKLDQDLLKRYLSHELPWLQTGGVKLLVEWTTRDLPRHQLPPSMASRLVYPVARRVHTDRACELEFVQQEVVSVEEMELALEEAKRACCFLAYPRTQVRADEGASLAAWWRLWRWKRKYADEWRAWKQNNAGKLFSRDLGIQELEDVFRLGCQCLVSRLEDGPDLARLGLRRVVLSEGLSPSSGRELLRSVGAWLEEASGVSLAVWSEQRQQTEQDVRNHCAQALFQKMVDSVTDEALADLLRLPVTETESFPFAVNTPGTLKACLHEWSQEAERWRTLSGSSQVTARNYDEVLVHLRNKLHELQDRWRICPSLERFTLVRGAEQASK